MDLERYEFETKNLLVYEFYSEGPNGRIKKVVKFNRIFLNGINYFNLGFGDWDESKKKINDFIVSDNCDKNKILATIASIIVHFTNNFSEVVVNATGSTLSRTRLYQISIVRHLDLIQPYLDIYGYIDGRWEAFRKNTNYEAFMAIKTNRKFII